MTASLHAFSAAKAPRTVPRCGPRNRRAQIRFCLGLLALLASACVPIGLFILGWDAAQRGALPRLPQIVEAR